MRGYLLILFAAMLWGTTGTSQALAPAGATPLAIGTMRLVVGGLVLLALALARGQFRRSGWLRPATLLSGITAAAYQMTFFAGVSLTGVTVGTIVGIGSAPIFAGLLGHTVRGEYLSRRWFFATALAVTGCVLLAFSGDATMQVNPLGLLLALGAGFSYALFTLVNKALLDTHAPDAVMAVSFCLGALFLLPVLLLVDTQWMLTVNGALVILHLGLIATGLSYMLFGRGLQTVPVSTTGTLTLAEPLTAALLGIFLLGEHLTPLAVLGIGILFAGLAVLVIRMPRQFPRR